LRLVWLLADVPPVTPDNVGAGHEYVVPEIAGLMLKATPAPCPPHIVLPEGVAVGAEGFAFTVRVAAFVATRPLKIARY